MKKTLAAIIVAFMIALPAFASGPAGPSAIAKSPARLRTFTASSPLTPPDQLRYPPLHFQVPQTETVVLKNGIKLYLYEDHELPLVRATALVRTGSVYDPEGKEGLADMTGSLLRDGGTRTMKSGEIDEMLARLAIDLESGIGVEAGSVSLTVLKKDVDAGLDAFARIMREPAFEESKIALAAGLRIEDIRRIADNPQRFAFREFNRVIYRNHPRGRVATVASIKNITRDDLVAFHKRFFHPANITIAISGAITKKEAVEKITRAFGDWKEEGPPAALPPPVPRQRGGVYFVVKKIPQSVVLIGQRGPSILSDDVFPFSLYDFIIGSGGFPSRIFQEVRTDEGLAYSAGSFYRGRTTDGVFGAYAFTKSATTGKALSLIRGIIRNGNGRPISEKELTWAKKSVDNSFIFSFTSAHQIAYQQMKIEYDGLPRNYLATYLDRIDRVALPELSRVKAGYVLPAEEIIFVVGNDEALQQLRSEFKAITVMEGTL